jgi:hypothetical protein
VILGEREPVAAEEPLIISASLEGLKKVIARLAELREASSDDPSTEVKFQKYVKHSVQLAKVGEDIQSLIKHLESENKAPLLVLGDQDVPGRELMPLGKGKALGEPMIWEAASRQLITYSDMHSVYYCPDMMPEPAHYYPGTQLVIGNDSGVIPFFRLNDVHEHGGWVEIVRTAISNAAAEPSP